MKRLVLAVAIVLMAAWAALLILQHVVGDPETDNVTDADDMPDFHASDPSLLEPGPYRIQERFPAANEWRSGADTPYFVRLADGRYACGYTNARGETKLLFTKAKLEHRVYWDDDAWREWRAVRAGRVR